MIESKDASKSDERQVKNTSNPLNRKSKGETHKMGERCMLKTFFVIALMLFATMLSVTAMAAPNDGMGKVVATWGTHAAATDSDGDGTIDTAGAISDTSTPLNSGSTMNALRFVYTSMAAGGAGTDDDMGYNMRDGMMRIAIPAGWKVPDKFRVAESTGGTFTGTAGTDFTVLYDTRTGTQMAMDDADHVGRVGFTADQWITVKLTGELWAEKTGATAARAIQITFMEVTTAIPAMLSTVPDTGDAYEAYTFSSSSMALNGTFIRLADANQPKVNIGNILGDKGVADSRDTLDKKVVITPKQEFAGEMNTKFTISFTSPGPIYAAGTNAAVLTIELGDGVAPSFGSTTTDDAANAAEGYTVRSSSGAKVDLSDTANNKSIPIDITKINKGQKITVTYSRKAALVEDKGGSFTSAITIPGIGANNTSAPEVEGGTLSAKDGSGMLALSPIAIEAGSQRRDITLTYTAYTDLEDKDIKVVPAGIVLDPEADEMLQTDSSTEYGYVTGSMNPSVVDDRMAIMWTNIDLKKGKTVKATIKRVNITAEVDEYPWDVYISPTATMKALVPLRDDGNVDGDELPVLSVTRTAGASVKFEVVEGHEVLRAGADNATIKFRFTAEDTTIRDGRVSLTIPSALGSAPTITKKVPGRVKVEIEGGTLAADQADKPGISGRTVNIGIKRLDVDGTVEVTYGRTDDDGKAAVLSDVSGDVNVTGTFRTSANASTRTAGTVTLTIGNIMDGTGMAVLSPSSLEAGSSHRVVEVTFTAAGTMDGGNVSLEIPAGWGDVQSTDPTQRNYVSVRGDGITSEPNTDGGRRIIAALGKLAAGDSFRFIIGSGTGGANNGVEVQDTVGFADFTIKSDGDGDTVYAAIASTLEFKDREKIRNPDKTGKIYKDAAGILKTKVTSALDGTGMVTVEPVEVRAADANVRLVFTYTPTQTIEDGALKLTVPSGWSKPQVEEDGRPGYTEAEGPSLGSATDDDKFSVTIPIISLDKDQDPIKITYGATDAGRAMASTVVGTESFKFEMKGHADGHFRVLRDQPTVEVKRQASGMGKAVLAVEGDALYAGDMDRKITVVYTAAGQMVAGKVRLTIPDKWSSPTVENVMDIMDTPSMTPTVDGPMVMVDGVNLMAGDTITFVYTGTVQPTDADNVKFHVAVHGGLDSDSYKDIPDTDDDATMLTVNVGQARAGSGMGMVSPMIVQAGETDVNIQFTYTVAGITDAPREFRVQVPASWTAPTDAVSGTVENKGAYSVEHRHGGAVTLTSIEKLDPIGRDMVARVKQGGLEVEAGDEIIFTYENADAPATPEISNFILIFDGKPIADSVQVRVQDSMPSQLSLSSSGTVSAAADAMPLAITVGIQDADGDAVAQNTDVMVTLNSSSAGTFSMMAGEAGTESIMVTIKGGTTSAMVYYMDSTAGTATITATAPGLTMASHDVTVEGDPEAMPEITSVTVTPTLAMAGEAVTVSAMGTAGQMAMFSVGSIVTDRAMMEDEAGSYSGSFDVVADMHAEGMYDVTVHLGTASAMGSLTIDSTAPTVTVTAPGSAANGDEVMISATVEDASAISSVSVDVSMLDSTQTDPVALAMGDDGAYSASVTISDDNSHANGPKTVTVTAMDAAGNSGMGTASVDLNNTLSYTSMIPAGLSLYHVPLDVDGLDTVGDLKMKLGDAVSLVIVYDRATGTWNSRSDDVMITADLGVVLSMGSATTLTLEGEAWGGGASMISLQAGPNLVGLPVDDPRVTNVSDIAGLFDEGVVLTIILPTGGGFAVVSDTTDAAVMGDTAYLVTASAAATVPLLGDGWSYEMASSAPIALAGYKVDSQTPVLDVQGAVVDEITGLAREGFRVKVKNLSTKASLSKVTSVETAVGYNMTFVDLKAGNAARIGDVLEISADSPSPLIGVKPVRHIVTVDDVKSGILALEDLIAYEIPAETELLRNYPNPFNPETWIPYRLAEDADVSLTIYDVNGTMVRSIDVGHQSAAVYESRSKAIYWDGRNRFGEQVASGIYFYSLSAGDFSATRKMVILK